jgi:hypothetical protein
MAIAETQPCSEVARFRVLRACGILAVRTVVDDAGDAGIPGGFEIIRTELHRDEKTFGKLSESCHGCTLIIHQ